MTYIIGNDVTTGSYATVARVKEASMAAGYKFEITNYKASLNSALVTVKNCGVAPLYHDAYVTIKGVRSDVSLKGLLPGSSIICEITGVSIDESESPVPTITSDKLLPGKTIPYQANLSATGIKNAPADSFIKLKGNVLEFDGENYFVTIYNSEGAKIVGTREASFDISTFGPGCFIVKYENSKGVVEVKKVLR
jgi:hypothetical protein